MDKEKDKMSRRINDFARRSFRDMADRDYIAARLACRARLMPQAMWSAQQCFEKYLKYILLVNRIPATKVKHNIAAALTLTKDVPFKLELSLESQKFIDHVARYGEYRYLEISTFAVGPVILELDKAVWEVRRYAQVLDVAGKELPADEHALLEDAKEKLRVCADRPPHEFRLNGGFLEELLKKKNDPAFEALIWENAYFGNEERTSVTVPTHFEGSNSPLYLYPEMLEELLTYIHIPKHICDGYRQHLKNIRADPSKRP